MKWGIWRKWLTGWMVSDSEETASRGRSTPPTLPLPLSSLLTWAAGSAGLGPGLESPVWLCSLRVPPQGAEFMCSHTFFLFLCVYLHSKKCHGFLSNDSFLSNNSFQRTYWYFFSFLIQQHLRSFHVSSPMGRFIQICLIL